MSFLEGGDHKSEKGISEHSNELLLIPFAYVYNKRSLNLFFTGITKFKGILGLQDTKTNIETDLLYQLSYNSLHTHSISRIRANIGDFNIQ